jgi:glycosyltransferase involved in cell wall biosynthesis
MVGQGKTIWLINHAAMPPQNEVRIQTLKRAQYLRDYGFKVYIISGSYLHNTDINLIEDSLPYKLVDYDGQHSFIHIRTKNYKGNGLQRILSLLTFYIRLWWFASRFPKPNYICNVVAVPFSCITYFIANKFKAKFIVDVVDLWPESFVAYGLVSKKNFLLKLSYLAEYWLYRKADLLIFSMEGGKDYIKEKGWSIEQGGKVDLSKIHYINNGVDLKDFEYYKEHFKIEDADLENDQLFRVVYVGSIRLANNLQQLIDAANLLKEYKNILFLVYGDGEDRNSLEELCKTKELTNVKFKQKWVELKYIPYILSKSSLNILNYKNSDILRFGGSQSKSFQYMASGKPICANVQMNYCPIKKFNLGIAQNFESSSAYANAILSIYNLNKEEYSLLCQNASEAAKHYDYQVLTNKFVAALQTI